MEERQVRPEQEDTLVDSYLEPKKAPNKFLLFMASVLLVTNIVSVVYFVFFSDLSEKKLVKIEKDTDNDGLSDELELKIGTDITMVDTDGDSYSDFEEYKNGYNPLGEGNIVDVVFQKNELDDMKQDMDIESTIVDVLTDDIQVEWTLEPIEVDDYDLFDEEKLAKLFEEKDIGNMDRMGGPLNSPSDFLAGVTVYSVGKIKSEKYNGKELFNMFVGPSGPGGDLLYRVIKNDQELIVLNNYSTELRDWYKDLFLQNAGVSLTNLEPLDEVIYGGELDAMVSMIKGDTEPRLMMTDIENPKLLFEMEGKKYYRNNLKGCIYTNASDGTVREYYYSNMSFIEKKESVVGLVPRHLNITWTDGEENVDDYIVNSYFGCGQTGCYEYADYIKTLDQLEEVGKTSSGESIYELKDKSIKRDAESKLSLLEDLYNQSHANRDVEKYNKFVNDHPLIFFEDPFDGFLEFKNAKYMPIAECGKPVIYLYPESEIDTRVYVDPNGGFTVTEPAYNDGWFVRAKPSGELYNYADKKVYPYLFWEGYAMDYLRPAEGFVIKRENAKEFLVEKLALLGLIEHEYEEFIEFWLPRMQEDPYYLVTFMDQADFDVLAPLTVVPTPDKVIRVFMDYEGLSTSIEISEPEIVTPERGGFTVVEWGGALHR